LKGASAVAGAAAFAGISGVLSSAQAAAPLKMKAAIYFGPEFAWYKGLQKFGEFIRQKSNGAMDLQIFGNGSLGSEKDYVQDMLQGTLDLAIVSTASAGGFAKELTFLDLMFIWKDRPTWEKALDGEIGRMIAEVIEKGTAKGGDPGLKILGYWGGSPRDVISRVRGYTTVKDLAGFKIRVQESPPQIEMWKLIGCIPTVVAYQETYGAIQAGVVDGLENEMGTCYQYKFYEVAPYISYTDHIITVRPLFMSGQTWAKLTLEQRPIVLEAAREATELARSTEWRQNDEAVAKMKAVGTKFFDFKEKDKLMDITRPVRVRVAREVGVTDIFAKIESLSKSAPAAKS